ncbi:cytochrome P450 315a1, mitochondrial [Trichogramma pretiosum]|uniref:cytochrome P450 315a1, mitochondrial n=1 Tax=Trichogramma pretiosum TaxID=7493 RepID=UPI0006C99BC6|nr:cytochrome P450 315a1, mitochondrial [Trichogramma pretiosum]
MKRISRLCLSAIQQQRATTTTTTTGQYGLPSKSTSSSSSSSSPAVAAAEMPDLRGPPWIGPLASILASGGGKYLHEYADKRHKRYGSCFRGRVGPTQALFVAGSDDIREVFRLEGATPQHFLPEAWSLYNQLRGRKRGLLFMEGQEWLDYRRVMNKLLLAPDSLGHMSRPCEETARGLLDSWRAYEDPRCVPDLEHRLYQWSIEVLLATLMGTPWSAYRPRVSSELGRLSRCLSGMFEHSVVLARLPATWAQRLGLPAWRGFVAKTDYSFETVERIVDEMARCPETDGLLRRMMDSGVRGEMLNRIVIDLIFAAGDTTAYAMQWLLLSLAANPEVQEELHELTRGLETREILAQPLLKGAIRESMRLYPIAPFLTRILTQDTLLSGYPAYKGELIVISLYTSSRDEGNFERASEFLPRRWLRNDKGEFNGVLCANMSLPFSMGVRSCIGRKLADAQIAITTAALLKKYQIDVLNKDRVKIKLRLISAPSRPLELRLTPRKE